MSQPQGVAGQPVTLSLAFFDQSTGQPADPSSITLDITYGEEVGFAPDAAGPFTYSGATNSLSGQVYRTGVGQYSFVWVIPASAALGVYVANWASVYGGATWLGFENFPVLGGFVPVAATANDFGFWTGGLSYTPPAGSTTAYSGAFVPLGSTDGNGISWLIEELEGWDSPDLQGAGVLPKAGDHGAFAAPQYYAARALTLSMDALAPTQALRDSARALLQQAVPVSDLCLFTYNEPVPKQAYVRRSARIVETYDDLGHVHFACVLVAPDPRKYSQQQNILSTNAQPAATGFTSPFTTPLSWGGALPAGSIAAVNSGNFETRPVITISGPCTAPGLVNVNTGQQVTWNSLVLGPSDTLVADFNIMQSYLNGTFYPADLPSSWWVLPPGTTTVQYVGSANNGSVMSATWRSAYI